MPPPSASDVRAHRWWLRGLARLPLPVFRAAGWLLGAALYLGAGRRRHIVQQNLDVCFPEASPAQRRRWAWDTFKHFGQTFVDRVWLWHGPAETVIRRVRIEGDLDGVERPGAVLHFVPHFYGMDAGWTRLTLTFSKPWWTFYAPQDNPVIDDWVREGRQRFGAPVLVSKHEGLRSLVRGLREGAALCLLPDMDLGPRDAAFVPFFGVPAATVTSAARLARLTGAVVIPFVTRMTETGYVAQAWPAWSDFPGEDPVAATRRMNEFIEQRVLEMRDRMLGRDHPDTLTSLSNLAATLYGAGDLDAAQHHQEQVLEARVQLLGPEHPDTLVAINNLAVTLYARGDLEEAPAPCDTESAPAPRDG